MFRGLNRRPSYQKPAVFTAVLPCECDIISAPCVWVCVGGSCLPPAAVQLVLLSSSPPFLLFLQRSRSRSWRCRRSHSPFWLRLQEAAAAQVHIQRLMQEKKIHSECLIKTLKPKKKTFKLTKKETETGKQNTNN